MLIYSEMSPHRTTNPLGLLTGRSECQITLLLGRRGKKDGDYRLGSAGRSSDNKGLERNEEVSTKGRHKRRGNSVEENNQSDS